LQPVPLISAWSKMSEVLPGHGYVMAQTVLLAYAIRGVPNPEDWRRSPRYFLENGAFPPEALGNRAGLLHVKSRLDEARAYRRELDQYVNGSSEIDPFQLGVRAGRGDEEANRELERIAEYRKAYMTPLLARIGENFSNTISLNARLGLALRDTEPKD